MMSSTLQGATAPATAAYSVPGSVLKAASAGGQKPAGTAAVPANRPDEADEDEDEKGNRSYEKSYRMTNDVAVELMGGDVPGAMSMLANSSMMPAGAAPAVGVFNVFNAATGYVGIASDFRETYDVQRNPKSTRMDKFMDWLHLIVGDIGSTSTDVIPILDTAMQQHPLSYLAFNFGQVLGMVMDTIHTAYDAKRGGAQSAIEGDARARARASILDNVEKRVFKMGAGMGQLGDYALGLGWTLGLPPALLLTMTTLGGSFGLIGAYTQIKKARDLKKQILDLQAHGKQTIAFPVVTRHGVEVKEISCDEALARTNKMRKWGIAQAGVSLLTTAAGITGAPALALAAAACGIGVAAAGAAITAYRNLPERYREKLDPIVLPVVHAAEKAARPVEHAAATAYRETTHGLAVGRRVLGQGFNWAWRKTEPVRAPIVAALQPVAHGLEDAVEETAHAMLETWRYAAPRVRHELEELNQALAAVTVPLEDGLEWAGRETVKGMHQFWTAADPVMGNKVEKVPKAVEPAGVGAAAAAA